MHNPKLFDVPNLDGMSPLDLQDAEHTFSILARYARLKLDASVQRLNGNIPAAIALGATADLEYSRLPEWAQW